VAERRELVVDAHRHRRSDRPAHEAVTLEGAQRLGEHLLADPGELTRDLGEPARPVGQGGDDERHPLVGDAVEDEPARAVGQERVELLLGLLALLRGGHGRHRALLVTSGCLLHFQVATPYWEATIAS
jgi:hypothetical protein